MHFLHSQSIESLALAYLVALILDSCAAKDLERLLFVLLLLMNRFVF